MNIYADNAATTKMSETAINTMVDCMKNIYGNPSSLYMLGQKAKEKLEECRLEVARMLNAHPGEIYFTSGGRAADNQALLSAAQLGKRNGKKTGVKQGQRDNSRRQEANSYSYLYSLRYFPRKTSQ